MWGRIREGLRRLAIVAAAAGFGYLALSALADSGWEPKAPEWLSGAIAIFWATLALLAFAYVKDGFGDPTLRPPRVARRARVLRTRRLVLRRAIPADIEPMHAILSDPEATRYWDTLPHSTIDATRDWMASLILENPATSDDFIILSRGRVIGMIGARRLPWVGFILAADCWRRGYGREALDAFVAYLFERGWSGVVAATDECNTAARALLEGAGFRETGRSSDVWQVRGQPSNAVHYQIDSPYRPPIAAEAAPALAK